MRCAQCGERRVLLAVTALLEQEALIQVKRPACACGEEAFYTVLCERIAVWDGEPSSFDEGVVAGKCASCGRLSTIVFTD